MLHPRIKEIWHKFTAMGRTRRWKNRDLKNNALRDFQQCCTRAGFRTHERLIQHCFRKNWATNLAQKGVPVKTLMKMGGWSCIETVEIFYLKFTDENEKQALEIPNGLVKAV
jgi:integrase